MGSWSNFVGAGLPAKGRAVDMLVNYTSCGPSLDNSTVQYFHENEGVGHGIPHVKPNQHPHEIQQRKSSITLA